jgi:hypothetical protein
MASVFSAESLVLDTGAIFPSTLTAGGKIHGDEQVGALLVDQDLEQVPHKLDRLISFHTPSLRLS